jgi:hypothetical protein
MAERKLNTGRAAWMAVLLLAAFWLGSAIPPRIARTGELQPTGATEPFLAGDERSIPVLKDILATVKQIDARLERLEKRVPAEQKP